MNFVLVRVLTSSSKGLVELLGEKGKSYYILAYPLAEQKKPPANIKRLQ